MHQMVVREGLYHTLQTAFDESGVPWQDCQLEDRGDGALILVPPEYPAHWLADRWPDRLLTHLRRYNAIHAEEARMRLRVSLHSGEVSENEQGVASQAINTAFRQLDAQQAKVALRASGGTLALIASDEFFHDVIKQEPAAAPASYQQIAVAMKDSRTLAWLRLLDAAQADTAPPGPGRHDVTALVDAALDIDILRDPRGRELVFDQLRPEIANAVPYFPRQRHHMFSLIQTCMNYPGGLQELIEVVRQLEGDSPVVHRFAAAADLVLTRDK
ncbi:hypothetical protein EV192_103342 [Actinocrispum wychmicini]|uniref:Effector-associated domain-containing protein n=2 Tax=Actinocrispum wychmicini TaxID=1213861 RepID=A0A4R2JP46_9PSEU|nr:hypothetical protein EV192_103342 [Actinocrispum wychmicini]